ncbi:MAG: beta-ketoacyl-[acyl-carrier-protein] synthase family protein [Bacillota bacterium]
MESIVVTGMGVVSSIGCYTEKFWESLLAGIDGINQITTFDVQEHANKRGCEVRNFQEFASVHSIGSEKVTTMLMTAIEDSFYQAKVDWFYPDIKIGLCVGTTMGKQGEVQKNNYLPIDNLNYGPNIIAENIARSLRLQGPVWTMTNACAAGNFAIAQAYNEINKGNADVMIVGGVDVLSWAAFTGFSSLRAMSKDFCRPFDINRKGLILGEGAGVVILEKESHARARKVEPLARILGYGLTCDAYHITQPDPEAKGAILSMHQALEMAGLSKKDIGYVSAHGTGTLANDRMEAYAMEQLFGEEILTSSIKGHIGHTLGAASVIEAVACVKMLQTGILPHTLHLDKVDPKCKVRVISHQPLIKQVDYILSNAYAFGGINSTVAFGKVD